MNGTVEQRLDSIDQKLAVTIEVGHRVEARVKETNGRLKEVEVAQHRLDGAIGAIRWMMGVAIGIMGIGAAIAGIVLGFVTK